MEIFGCFNDKNGVNRPFPDYTDLRSKIDWKDISKIVNECGNLVLSKGYEVRHFTKPYEGRAIWGVVHIKVMKLGCGNIQEKGFSKI